MRPEKIQATDCCSSWPPAPFRAAGPRVQGSSLPHVTSWQPPVGSRVWNSLVQLIRASLSIDDLWTNCCIQF